jgi:threonine/homoserine/homoserine lactone efflux protein
MTYNEIAHHIWLGFTSSFLGTLPLGMLNLTILQLALANRQRQATAFSLGATLIEVVQIGITLLSMNVLSAIPRLSQAISIISIPILLYLGYQNFKKRQNTVEERNPEEGGKGEQKKLKSAFWQGVVLGFANVVVYPFWLLWGNFFVQNGWLLPTPEAYFYFSLAAGLGTFGAFLFFILLGKILWKRLSRVQKIIDQLIGYTFFGFAAFQFFKIFSA